MQNQAPAVDHFKMPLAEFEEICHRIAQLPYHSAAPMMDILRRLPAVTEDDVARMNEKINRDALVDSKEAVAQPEKE